MKGFNFLSNLADMLKGVEKPKAEKSANSDLTVSPPMVKTISERTTPYDYDAVGLAFPIKAFVSYSHIDKEGMLKLRSALSPLMRKKKLELWDDQAIDLGTEWLEEINEKLLQAKIVFCLVSQEFIDSDFCYEKELKAALDAHANQEKTVVPIRFRMCHWDGLPLASIQSTPNDGWIKSKEDQDAAWTAVAKSTERLLDKLVARANQQQSLMADDHTIEINHKRNAFAETQQRKSKIEQKIDEIHEERNELIESYNSPHKDIAYWLNNNKEAIVDKIFSTMCLNVFDGDIPMGFPQTHSEIRTFKLQLEQFIDSLGVCLVVDSTSLIAEPSLHLKFRDQYYINAMSLLKEKIPISIPNQSKEKLLAFIDYLTVRISSQSFLSRSEKFRLLQLLMEELAKEEGVVLQ